MAVNPLPPQAYTKETLQKAYQWLLTQPTSIKEMASSQDMLISLYLKTQRNGEAALDTPSIQNFKQELKSLAGIIGDLQPPQHQAHQPAVNPAIVTTSLPMPTNAPVNHAAGASASPHPTSTSSSANLDSTSLQAVAEVRQTLNLSSDAEALRALIALGHKQFKKIY